MTPDFSPASLRGGDAIERANSRSSKFSPYAPRLTWTKDQEEKHILFLSPIEKVYTADIHEFVEVGEGEKANGEKYTKFESFISRKSLGEGTDDIQDRLGREPRRRSLGVAVELEPEYETVRGRQRAKSFKVKTEQFTRTTDDGEVDVDAPVIGMVIQAQKNFYGWLNSYDRTQGPVHETPMKVVRRGTDQDTTYDFIAMEGVDVDFEPLLANLDNIAYLRDTDGLEDLIKDSEDDYTAAAAVGTAFLEKRWDELADGTRYSTIIDPIQELPASRFASKPKPQPRSARPARRTQREAATPKDEERLREFAKLREEVGAE
jgi:hypothetical protein